MSYNNLIKSNDPQAVEKLLENIQTLEDRLEYMQSVNDYFKKHGTTKGHPDISDEGAMALDKRVKDGNRTPYPGQFFTDNRKEIQRLKSVIERLENNPETVFKGWRFYGGEAVVNLANNRLQLMFDEKPSEEQIATLKKSFFKWAPKAKSWQRVLSHQTMSLADKISFIRPRDGRKPTDLQPKAPKKKDFER